MYLIIIIVLSVCLLLVLFLFSISILLLQLQTKDKKITLYTTPTLGICPSNWRKNNYTNGVYCIEPGVYAIVDDKNNFIDARRGTCTQGKIISSTLSLPTDKQYYCESY